MTSKQYPEKKHDISIADTEYEKFIGLVKDFKYINKYNNDQINNCIGHVRYSTTGDSDTKNIGPLTFNMGKYSLSIAHNGNLVNIENIIVTY